MVAENGVCGQVILGNSGPPTSCSELFSLEYGLLWKEKPMHGIKH